MVTCWGERQWDLVDPKAVDEDLEVRVHGGDVTTSGISVIGSRCRTSESGCTLGKAPISLLVAGGGYE